MNEQERSVNFRLELYRVRARLLNKTPKIHKPVKAMIKNGLWTKTHKDTDYLLGRTLNPEFLEALKKLDKLIK